LRRILAAALALLVLIGVSRSALAIPVIEPGREPEIVALFAPYALGEDVTPGLRLMWIKVEPTHIRAIVEDAGGPVATLRLDHTSRAPKDGRIGERSESFVLSGEPPGHPVLERLAGAVRGNDRGGFWRVDAPVGPGQSGPPQGPGILTLDAGTWYTDGLVLGVGVLGLLIALVRRQLRDTPRKVGWALAGIVLGGAALRLLLAPEAALGAWPYSRIIYLSTFLHGSPTLGAVTEALGARIHLTDLIFRSNLVIAIFTPLALFAHAHYVLKDHRAALAAAALIAVLPNHIHFSRSEVEFIPSITLSSIAFALVHAALDEPSRTARWAATALLPPLTIAALWTRPLNVLLVPLLLASAIALRPASAPRPRVAVVVSLIVGCGVAGVFGHLLPIYGREVNDGLRLGTAWNSVIVLFSPSHNTLINPRITPLGITALAIVGFVGLWRRGERRHAGFLAGWLAFYFITNSYVMPTEPAMQARYHLHLAPPLVLLAAPGLVDIYRQRPRLGIAACVYLAACPLLHSSYVRDTAFNDAREFAFVREARDQIPDGCTILEYTGPGVGDHDARFARMGAVLDRGKLDTRWRVVPAGGPLGPPPAEGQPADPGHDPLRPEARALLANPPECLMIYEGLPCLSEKPPGEPTAPACAALRDDPRVERVATERFESRPYDDNLTKGFGPDLREIGLTLYRVGPSRAAP
jgi:hypothetical protein